MQHFFFNYMNLVLVLISKINIQICIADWNSFSTITYIYHTEADIWGIKIISKYNHRRELQRLGTISNHNYSYNRFLVRF